jgi:FdhD protein
MSTKPYQTVNRQRYRLAEGGYFEMHLSQDLVISEEPLNIVLHWTCQQSGEQLEQTLMVTMRTPGDDASLVTGLLLSHAVIEHVDQIQSIMSSELNQCDITLATSVVLDWEALTRHFISHSGCGICGTSNVKKLAHTFNVTIDETPQWLPVSALITFSTQLRQHQSLFSLTGGVHSAGIFSLQACLSVKEDVGRHNAVDKVVGDLLAKNKLDNQSILMLSGRISFELMQKAVAAKIPVVVAIGAPSSLAIAVAKQFNITLIGFVSEHAFNVYHGDFRLQKQH